MLNSILYLFILSITRFMQIVNVSLAIIKNQISYYPPSISALEKKFSLITGTKHALTFCNATSAIEAALFAGGIKNGSIVGTTAFVIPSSYSSVKSLSAEVSYIDINPETLNFETNFLLDNKKKLDALIVTHFYGVPCNMSLIMDWAIQNNVFVIEDCSHAHGAKHKDQPLGSWGDIGVFSLQGAKAVAAGEGAVAISSNSRTINSMAAYGHQESYKKFKFGTSENNLPSFGYGKKMRAHPLGAVLAIEDLKRLPSKNKVFHSWFSQIQIISEGSTNFSLPLIKEGDEIGGYCQGLPLIVKDKTSASELIKKLKAIKINCFQRDYSQTLEEYSNLSMLNIQKALPQTIRAFDNVIFIPFNQFILPWRWFYLKRILKDF